MPFIAANNGHLNNFYSKTVIDYLNQSPQLQPFYHYAPTLDGYKQKVAQRTFSAQQRQLLVEVLQQQYGDLLSDNNPVANNIQALTNENTYTVTTGQQIHIYLGPLYVVNKILSTIAQCQWLEENFEGKKFVPVFWMATEDHDFEEISHLQLFYKQFAWPQPQDYNGAVGRIAPQSINQLEGEIREVLNNDEEAKKLLDLFTDAYTRYTTLADATRYIVHQLFGHEGLVVIDADNTQLKQVLKPYIYNDVFTGKNFETVNKTSALLEENYKAQIHPREINFFYLTENGRYRLALENGVYKALDSQIAFSEEQIKKEIEQHPEHFSPNVVMRPVYQELILPNIAYIGGPAEVNYWLQLKDCFDANEVQFPIIELRQSIILINSKIAEKVEGMGFTIADFLQEAKELEAEFVSKNSSGTPDYSTHYKAIEAELEAIKNKALEVDNNLRPFLEGEFKKITDTFEKLDAKLDKLEKKKFENQLKQIENIKTKFFTPHQLAERTDTMLSAAFLSNQHNIEALLININQQKIPLVIAIPPFE